MKLTGTIKLIKETESFSSGFTKRPFVVTTAEQYPQDIQLEFTKDKCGILDKYSQGDSVIVEFNLRGNEYQGRYFVNLQAWKIEKTGENEPKKEDTNTETTEQEPDSLPF